MVYSNKGMYLEEVINRSIDYFKSNEICYFEKRFVPFKFLKKLNKNKFIGIIQSKSMVDYFGFINHEHVEFETKETDNDYFSVGSIMEHQYEWMRWCAAKRIKTFVIIYFSLYEEFYIVPFQFIAEQKRYGKIKRDDINKKFTPELLTFPGIVNFIKKM